MKKIFSEGKRSTLAWLAIGLLGGSGTISAQVIPGLSDTTGIPDGDYALAAVATGTDASQNSSVPVQVAVGDYAIHAGPFTVAKSSAKGQWKATVTYTVHDTAHQPMPG